MSYTLEEITEIYLGSTADLDEIEDKNPEAYEALEHFVAAGNSDSQSKKRHHYYEALNVVTEGVEKYDKQSDQYLQLKPLYQKLASTPMR